MVDAGLIYNNLEIVRIHNGNYCPSHNLWIQIRLESTDTNTCVDD